MNEITIRLHTEKPKIDPDFFDNLNNLAEQYGLQVKESTQNTEYDSVQMIREDREWLDQREEERVAHSQGARDDLSHLDRMKG